MKVLVLSGGQHPYQETTPILESFLRATGHEVSVTEEASDLTSKAMPDYDVLVFNTRREKELSLTEEQQASMTQFIGGGNGFVCIHIAGCRPDGWHEYHDVTGGGWISGTSTHPPYGQFTVNVKDAAHPVAEGIADFVTNDELYIKLAWLEGNHVFLTAELDGETRPLAWSRKYGKGRVFKTTLGHDGLSFQTPEFQRLVLNGVAWAGSGKPESTDGQGWTA